MKIQINKKNKNTLSKLVSIIIPIQLDCKDLQ